MGVECKLFREKFLFEEFFGWEDECVVFEFIVLLRGLVLFWSLLNKVYLYL